MNTEFVARERARMAREAAGIMPASLTATMEGRGMNRTPPHVATPQVAGVMATRHDVDFTPHSGQRMRRRASQRHKGHKFTRFGAIGAIPRGVADTATSGRARRASDADSGASTYGSLPALPPAGMTDLSMRYEPNGRNL